MVFSDTTNNTGIVQQTRYLARVDSTQWSTAKITNSANNWLDFLTGYAIGSDKRFQWDDTNHTELPEGTTNAVSGQSDYSFLTDEQGNTILTLLGVSYLNNTYYEPLDPVDRKNQSYNIATFGQTSGTPSAYDKIADNIIRLDTKPSASVTNGLKFYFQRTPSYFTATDTTKSPGVAPILHRGFVIASAYDCALTLGLANLQALSVERSREEERVKDYFAHRNNDDSRVMTHRKIRFI